MKALTVMDQLASEDRHFFELVAEAAFSNPFSVKRDDLDYQISQAKGSIKGLELISATTSAVASRIAKVVGSNGLQVNNFQGRDRELIKHASLFVVFHDVSPDIDQYISEQVARPEKVLSVPFTDDVIAKLKSYGFSLAEAERYIAIFFQLRRAYFFLTNNLIGVAPSIVALRCHLWENIFTQNPIFYENYLWDRMEDFSTLLLGATGCGKGTVAASIGRSGFIAFCSKKKTFSENFTASCVAINLSQYPENLLESELFGHRKGAFTGAIDNYEGVFSRCSRFGAIFMDEVGELSIHVQVKLLKVLQERMFSPVGSSENKRFYGRVIAATNQPIHRLRKDGQFRDDLYYRLCTDVIEIPSLRQRIQEAPVELELLVTALVKESLGEVNEEMAIYVKQALESCVPKDYHWPGNVRELEQAVRRIMLNGAYRPEVHSASNSSGKIEQGMREGLYSANELMREYCRILYEKLHTYEEVAKRLGIDPRTVKKHLN